MRDKRMLVRAPVRSTWGAAALAAVLCLPAAAAAHETTTRQDEIGLLPTAGGGQERLASHGDPVAEFRGGKLSNESTVAASQASTETALPGYCPAHERTSDDTRNAVYPLGSPTIKVVYANAADAPNRLAAVAPVMQAGAKGISDFATSESLGRLSVRFDVGNYEGAGCLDIQHVPLPQPTAAYLNPDTSFDLIANDVAARLGVQPPPRDFLIYADNIPLPGIAGTAERCTDDSVAGSCHAAGGLVAVLYGRGGTDFFTSGVGFPDGQTSRRHVEVAMHELTHNLGAVQGSAPHTSGAGHCNDEYDLMCYEDGGPGVPFVSPTCDSPAPYNINFQAWDCNKDDYFNVAPAGGSYLATHWNVARSTFLCPIAACNPPDTTPPDTQLMQVPRKKSRRRRGQVTFDATERSSFACQLDNGHAIPCTSPFSFKVKKKKSKKGKHLLLVTATDQAGNVEPDPASVRFKVLKKR